MIWATEGNRASSSYGPYLTTTLDMRNKSVLELGCGNLEFSRYEYGNDHTNIGYIGLDISRNALRGAKINHPNAALVRADAIALPFKDKSFDIVFAIETITCSERDAYAIIKEAGRVLSRNGTLFFDAVHSDLYKYNMDYKPYVDFIGNDHYGTLLRGKITNTNIVTYDEQGISSLLRSVGLKEQRIDVLTSYEHENLMVPIYQRLPGTSYSEVKSSILVTATKD